MAAPVRRRTPTPAPRSADESGIIDVRAIAAVLADERAPRRAAVTPIAMTPTMAPTMTPTMRSASAMRSTAAPRKSAASPSPRPILGAVAFTLAFALVGLTGYALARQPAPELKRATEGEAKILVVEGRVAAPATEESPEDEASDEVDAPEPAAEAETPEAAGTAEIEATKPTSRSSRRRSARTPGEPSKTPVAAPTSPSTPTGTVTPASPAKDTTTVDCLLEPDSCRDKPKPVKVRDEPPPAPSETLPSTLAPAEISAGTRATKSAAVNACRALAKPGEIVRIKLSIAGPTGTVLSTSVEAAGENAELAPCCARELAKSTFPRVQKEQIGAVVTVRF